MAHTINQEEIEEARRLLIRAFSPAADAAHSTD
jgi:hypothetical protein